MKTKWLYSPGSSAKAKGALFQKMFLMAMIVALISAFLPQVSVFAAEGNGLEEEWSNKLSMVRSENLFYAQLKLFPVDFKRAEDMARPYELLAIYGSALKQANKIITEHAGFDETGDVIDTEEAWQSTQDLGACLHAMRGALAKIDEEGYPIHRVK